MHANNTQEYFLLQAEFHASMMDTEGLATENYLTKAGLPVESVETVRRHISDLLMLLQSYKTSNIKNV